MTNERSPSHAAVFGLFFLSGAIGLVFEVLWSARLGLVFGHAAHAAAATLLAFFLGLAVGAWTWGRWSAGLARPLRAYGLLEIGVGVTAGAALLLDDAHAALYGLVVDNLGTEGTGLTVARLLLAVLLLFPSAFLMGGTLPVLGSYVVTRREALGERASLLYASNTVGAAAGALLGGFVLPPLLGYRLSYLGAMAAALVVGGLALVLARREVPRATRASPPSPGRQEAAGSWGRLSALAFLSGALALVLQVVWMRLFSRVFLNSVQVFATILAVYLLALGAAGALAHRLAARAEATRPTLAVLLSIAGGLVAASGALYLGATEGAVFAPLAGWSGYLLRASAVMLLVVFPPVLVLGAVFPFLWRMAEDSPRDSGRVLGGLAGWNTLGAGLGAVTAAFVLLPTVGVWASLRGAALVYAFLGMIVALSSTSGWAKALALTFLIATATGFWPLPTPARPRPGERLLDVWEGPSGTVAVFQADDVRKLRFNDVFTLGGSEDSRWERLQTHVALGMHPAPRSVFYLGMGTGITAGAALSHDLDRVVVAELVPEVVAAARAHFAEQTDGLFDSPLVEIVEDDGRHALAFSRERYDVVIGDLFFPWEAGAAELFTREHFESVRSRLAPGGVFVQWLPGYQLSEKEFLSIAREFVDVFPLVTLWRGDFLSERPIVALVGHQRTDPLDGGRLVARATSLAGRDATGLADHPTALPFMFYAGNLTAARELVADARPHTADRPWIAWDAPRELRRRAAGEVQPFTADRLLGFEEKLAEAVSRDTDPYLARLSAPERRRVSAGLALRRISVYDRAMRTEEHRAALREWILLVPADQRPDLGEWTD